MSSYLSSCFDEEEEPLSTTIDENETLFQAVGKISQLDNSILLLQRLRLVEHGRELFEPQEPQIRSSKVGKKDLIDEGNKGVKSEVKQSDNSLGKENSEFDSKEKHLSCMLNTDSDKLSMLQQKEYRECLASCLDRCFKGQQPLSTSRDQN
uniref:Uncharacterized protein n=1 Tax=Panagrolaimus sp. ES5 TaxID=591445 RepID=A0AC34GHS5_9BILA